MTQPHADLRGKTVRGLMWQFLGVGGQRIVQLIAPVVIARTLDKPDISLFVVIMTGMGLIESLTLFMGEQSTIASERGADRRYLDTVFTVRVLRSFVISGAICAISPGLAWFFADPATEGRYWLTGLFMATAAYGVIDGLQSPARAKSLKSLEFRRIVLGDFVAAVLGMLITIALAVLWRDVWALVCGFLGTTAIRTVISYASAPHRPRFHIDREALHDLFQYSKGASGQPFLVFVTLAAPALVLGKLPNRDALADYDYAGRIAKVPEDIFLRVLGPVAVPAYAQLRADLPRLARAWLGAVQTYLLVAAPMTVSMAWCGGALPALAFGETYGTIGGLFSLQCVYGGLSGLTAVIGPVFWAIGQPHRDRRAQLVRCVVIYALGIPAALSFGVVGFAAAACISIALALLLCIVQARHILAVSCGEFLGAIRQGTILGVGLLAVFLLLDAVWSPTGIWRLLASAAIGGPALAIVAVQVLRHRHGAPAAPAALDDAT